MAPVAAGQRFPFINLEKAVSRAQQLYQADPRGKPMAVATAFQVWEYSEKSSGGFQTIAALKSYGLLVDEGANLDRKVRLSDDGLRYFRDERDDEKLKLIQRFALSPALFRVLWKDDKWSEGIPADTIARSHLKLDRKLNEQSARSALAIFRDNAGFAKLKGDAKVPDKSPDEGSSTDDNPDVGIGDVIQWTSGGVDQLNPPMPVTKVSEDGAFVWVVGSMTAIPASEVTIVNAAQPNVNAPKVDPVRNLSEQDAPDISVLMAGQRLRITADVDEHGLEKLKQMIAKYEEILKLMKNG